MAEETQRGATSTSPGTAYNTMLVTVGDELGPYPALAGAGLLSSKELADRTGTAERYVRAVVQCAGRQRIPALRL